MVALPLAFRAYDEHRARGDGQQAINELEDNYLTVTNMTIRAMEVAHEAILLGTDEDPNHNITQVNCLYSWLTAVKEPVTGRYSM